MYKYLESFNQFDVQVSEGLAPSSSWPFGSCSSFERTTTAASKETDQGPPSAAAESF